LDTGVIQFLPLLYKDLEANHSTTVTYWYLDDLSRDAPLEEKGHVITTLQISILINLAKGVMVMGFHNGNTKQLNSS
jgi:hypothetical protein